MTIDSCVSSLSSDRCWSQVSSAITTAMPAMKASRGHSSEWIPESSMRSMNTRRKPGTAIPGTTSSRLTSRIMVSAPVVPVSRPRSSFKPLARLPPFSKSSPGSKVSAMPVKLPSNSDQGIRRGPAAGSLISTLSRLNPSITRKWLKFQKMTNGGLSSRATLASIANPFASKP